ncbi:MAG: Hpt domain-containing protein, partial [Acidobacteria bacterium]|nr:Hpt domain-containing protein [Acidobacteriota bacterium]
LKAQIESGASVAMQEEAHALKGISHNMGAERMGEVCRLLEMLGASGSLQGAEELLGLLETEFRLLQGELTVQASSLVT